MVGGYLSLWLCTIPHSRRESRERSRTILGVSCDEGNQGFLEKLALLVFCLGLTGSVSRAVRDRGTGCGGVLFVWQPT